MTTSILETVTSAFAAALGRTELGRSDNFFAAGGDSIGATMILARIETELGVALRYRDFLEAPTPALLGVTVLIERARQGGDLATEIAALSEADAAVLVAELERRGQPL
ncbi:MAG TPA: phosphopantetheine-binding protein [Kofleriaceae bacterium]